MLIDAHHHLWDPARGDYGWMPEGDPVLDRTYQAQDLVPFLDACGISKTVIVQAAPTIAETDYLLRLADDCDRIAKVVGWIDFENKSDIKQLERLSSHPKFAGVRPMVQDIPDPDWLLRDDIRWAFEAITDLDLTFDALGFPVHLENFLVIAERHPSMRFVIDHAMKPRIADAGNSAENFDHWSNGMARLANQTGAFCKLSGLVTEAGSDWSPNTLRPYVDTVLSLFGPERVMWGSDWPVCRLRCDYETWFEAATALTAHLGAPAQGAIFGQTARTFYRID